MTMRRQAAGKQLTIYIGDLDRYHHHPLSEAILERARQEGLAGATIMRGIEGFGAGGRLKTNRFLSSSDDLPVVIQIVDDAHRIERFLPILQLMVTDGLVTVEDVSMQTFRRADPYPLDDTPEPDPGGEMSAIGEEPDHD
jgi:PII-like signaling protein